GTVSAAAGSSWSAARRASRRTRRPTARRLRSGARRRRRFRRRVRGGRALPGRRSASPFQVAREEGGRGARVVVGAEDRGEALVVHLDRYIEDVAQRGDE